MIANQMYQSKITSTGSYFPEKIVTNFDLEKTIDTNDEWIFERTGIKERRIADQSKDLTNSELAFRATKIALERANLTADDLDCIVFCTVSADRIVPTAACLLQEKLQTKKDIPSFDLSAACSGFVYGLSVADAFIRMGQYKNVLVVGAEVLSTMVDWQDRNTCILFGDGAGVAIVSRSESQNDSAKQSKVYSTHLHADGKLKELFYIQAGGSAERIDASVLEKRTQFMKMKGKEIFKEAVRTLADCAAEVLEHNKVDLKDVDWFIPHQANMRIIEAVAKRLHFPMDKVITNVRNFGNTSAATVPTALDQAITDGRIKRGDLILISVFGAGLTFGSALIRY